MNEVEGDSLSCSYMVETHGIYFIHAIGLNAAGACSQSVNCSFTILNQMQIYISPANHYKPYTGYTVDEWNEKKNMELVADYLVSYLSNYRVSTYLDKTDRSGGQ